MNLEIGKVYQLTETDFSYYSPRVIVARFEGIEMAPESYFAELLHKFLCSDGRTATIRIKDWDIEEGSELIWALG